MMFSRVGNYNKSLSKRQKEILAVINESLQHRGYPPSIREIGLAVGLSSSSTVHSHLRSLEAKGYLRRAPSKPRGMTVVHPVDGVGCCKACGERPGATKMAQVWKASAKSIRARAPVVMPRRHRIEEPPPGVPVSPVTKFLVYA